MGLRLLKPGGFLFAIVPNGYLGNATQSNLTLRKMIINKYRLVGIIKLPDNSFIRSGAAVSTSIMIIKNENMVDEEANRITDYNIYIKELNDIGYVLNRKNTPIKYSTDILGIICMIKIKIPLLKMTLMKH